MSHGWLLDSLGALPKGGQSQWRFRIEPASVAVHRFMVVNHQSKVAVDVADVRAFARALSTALRLKGQSFNVCIVDDGGIQRLNAAHRGKPRATDVLSFPWNDPGRDGTSPKYEFSGFLGDVVVSAEMARRNAAAEGHSRRNEIRWLVLHGVLHLLGYDHSTDHGEMTALELRLRDQFGIGGRPTKKTSKSKWQPTLANCARR